MEIPAILLINQTYGRKNGKLLYKCIPYKNPTFFLVPYEVKKMQFSKVQVNLFVIIKFVEFGKELSHGTLLNTIGPVNILENYYTYQLYCKNLNVSLKNLTNSITILPTIFQDISNKFQIENRTRIKTFSIDPSGCSDFDDAFSIEPNKISIYIANVPLMIDHLNIWEHLTSRVSTIYLPDKKYSMLPLILSENICSLKSGTPRLVFAMDSYLDGNTIIDIKYSNCMIYVFKNYIYEEPSLLVCNHYKLLKEITIKLSEKYNYIDCITDSHDIVCYLMILMNYHCAQSMATIGNGIYRVVKKSESKDVPKFLKILNSSGGLYTTENAAHEMLELDSYIHITSPIRRLVDILNMIKFQENMGVILSPDAAIFYDKWIVKLDYINTATKDIRKIQNNCTLLDAVENNPELLSTIYDGYCFDNNSVYLPELKLVSRIKIDIALYEKRQFKLFLFKDENEIVRKVRLQLI